MTDQADDGLGRPADGVGNPSAGVVLDRLLPAAGLGLLVVAVQADGLRIRVDPVAASLFGFAPAPADLELVALLDGVHGRDRTRVRTWLEPPWPEADLPTGTFAFRTRAGADEVRVRATATVFHTDGRTDAAPRLAVLCRAEDASDDGAAAVALDRARWVQWTASALARAVGLGDVAAAALRHAAIGVGAVASAILLTDRARGVLGLVAGLDNLDARMRERWSRLPLEAWTPLNRALETGEPQLLSRGQALEDYPHLARDVDAAGAGFYAMLPLRTTGTPFGVLALGWLGTDGPDADGMGFLTAMADLSAQALEKAQLYEQQRRIAESLQLSLLPQALPGVRGLDFGARYVPGAAGLQVGGDWYDALPLPDGRVAVALGDVVGKGLPAAAAMGQVRYALRAYAMLDAAPARVLGALDTFFADRDDEELVTLVYGVLDPRDGSFVWTNAGHPAPLLVGARTGLLSGVGDGTPLGVADERRETTTRLSPGEGLLLYSDGVVESRQRPVGQGMSRLTEVVTDLGGDGSPPEGAWQAVDAENLCAQVLLRMTGGTDPEDDATLLAVRWTGVVGDVGADGGTERRASTQLSPEALASSSARRFLRGLLQRWLPSEVEESGTTAGVDGTDPDAGSGAGGSGSRELVETAELCVSELVTNAVLHARTPIRLEVTVTYGTLRVEVCDSGGAPFAMPDVDDVEQALESGRGLQIVQLLSTRAGVATRRDGACVWFELTMPGPGAREHSEATWS